MGTFLLHDGVLLAKRDTEHQFRIDFAEMRFKDVDGKLVAWFWVESFSPEGAMLPDKTSKEKFKLPGLVAFEFDETKPSQKVVAAEIRKLDTAKIYAGFINIDDDSAFVKANAESRPQMVIGSLFAAIEISVENPNLTDAVLAMPKKRGGGYGSKSESVSERYQMRLKLMAEALGCEPNLSDCAFLVSNMEGSGDAFLRVFAVLTA